MLVNHVRDHWVTEATRKKMETTLTKYFKTETDMFQKITEKSGDWNVALYHHLAAAVFDQSVADTPWLLWLRVFRHQDYDQDFNQDY